MDYYDRREYEKNEQFEQLPVCEACGYEIQDYYLHDIDGHVYCCDCVSDSQIAVEEYVDSLKNMFDFAERK